MSQPKEYLQAGVMQFTFGSFTGDFFVAAVPGEKKAVAVTGLVTDEKNHDASMEDAKRIAACWNAFDGIPTEKFEGKSIEEFITTQAYLTGMQPSLYKEGFNIGLTGLACQMLAASFAGQFVGTGATNFLEINMEHPAIGDFNVTIQKTSGLTPAQLKAQAEKERDEAMSLLTELMDTELAEMGCAGSHAPIEDILGRIQQLLAKSKGGAA
jgi:hypothetical protein